MATGSSTSLNVTLVMLVSYNSREEWIITNFGYEGNLLYENFEIDKHGFCHHLKANTVITFH